MEYVDEPAFFGQCYEQLKEWQPLTESVQAVTGLHWKKIKIINNERQYKLAILN